MFRRPARPRSGPLQGGVLSAKEYVLKGGYPYALAPIPFLCPVWSWAVRSQGLQLRCRIMGLHEKGAALYGTAPFGVEAGEGYRTTWIRTERTPASFRSWST